MDSLQDDAEQSYMTLMNLRVNSFCFQNFYNKKFRDLFNKIIDIKGIFHAKMGSIKDRNGMDLTEAENIKKRWQEYTELYKKDLHNQIIMMV